MEESVHLRCEMRTRAKLEEVVRCHDECRNAFGDLESQVKSGLREVR